MQTNQLIACHQFIGPFPVQHSRREINQEKCKLYTPLTGKKILLALPEQQPLTHTPTHSLTHTTTQTPLTLPLTHSVSHSVTQSLTHSLKHSLTHPFTHTVTHPHTHSVTRSLTDISVQVGDRVPEAVPAGRRTPAPLSPSSSCSTRRSVKSLGRRGGSSSSSSSIACEYRYCTGAQVSENKLNMSEILATMLIKPPRVYTRSVHHMVI